MPSKASRDSQAEVWQVSFQVPAALEEAATEILVMALGQSASSYCPLESDQAEISAFITQRSAWNLSKSREVQACLQDCFPELLEKSSLTFRCRKIKESDWRESWKSHFKPLEIGKRLLIKPSWSKKQPKKGQKLITLDTRNILFICGGAFSGIEQHIEQMGDRSALIAADIGYARLKQGLGNGKNALAVKVLALAQAQRFHFLAE